CSLADRAGFIAFVARPATISNLRAEDVRIRVLGDVAVIHGRTTYTKADGSAGAGRYTDVWARRKGRWLCVAAQVARGGARESSRAEGCSSNPRSRRACTTTPERARRG